MSRVAGIDRRYLPHRSVRARLTGGVLDSEAPEWFSHRLRQQFSDDRAATK